MVISDRVKEVAFLLEDNFPNTHTFLNYETDWQLLFAIILSAQATDKSVNEATAVLFRKFPKLTDYTPENKDDILSCIKRVGLSNSKVGYLLSTAEILVRDYQGMVPKDRECLMKLPGCGYKTSGVFLAEYYDYPFIPVDTHVKRVSSRLGLVSDKLSPDDTERRLEKLFQGEHSIAIHRQLILLGRTYCKAVKPLCLHCPFRHCCRMNGKNQKKQSQ